MCQQDTLQQPAQEPASQERKKLNIRKKGEHRLQAATSAQERQNQRPIIAQGPGWCMPFSYERRSHTSSPRESVVVGPPADSSDNQPATCVNDTLAALFSHAAQSKQTLIAMPTSQRTSKQLPSMPMMPTIGQSTPGVCNTLAGLFAYAAKSTATLNPMPTSGSSFEEASASQNSSAPKNRPAPKSVTKINNRARKAQAKKTAKTSQEVIKNEDSDYSRSDTEISPQLNPKAAQLNPSPKLKPAAVAASPGFLPTTTMIYCGNDAGNQPPQQLNPVVAMLFKQQVDNTNMPAWLLN